MGGPGRPENLKMWKKGQSGNPGGRPKRKPDIEALNALIAEKGLERLLVNALFSLAVGNQKKGIPANIQAIKLILEYRNGTPPSEAETIVNPNDPDEAPRIVIPGSPFDHSGGQKAKGRASKRKPTP